MGFHVYPDPQAAPFTVSPGAASSPVIALTTAAINAQGLIGPDNVNEPGVTPTLHPTTVFIRFAMSGTLPLPAQKPTVVIKLGAGTATEINTAVGTPTTLLDPANMSDTAYGIRYDPDANNVYVVKVLVVIPGSYWEMAIKNNAAAARTFTCVIAGSLADSRQPWIDILPVPLPPGATTNYDAVPGPESSTPRDAVGCQLRNRTADHQRHNWDCRGRGQFHHCREGSHRAAEGRASGSTTLCRSGA